MTRPLTFASGAMSASGVAEGVGVTLVCSCGLSKRVPIREQWKFLAREQHWGHVFLVWTLTGNPSARNEMGKRFAPVVL